MGASMSAISVWLSLLVTNRSGFWPRRIFHFPPRIGKWFPEASLRPPSALPGKKFRCPPPASAHTSQTVSQYNPPPCRRRVAPSRALPIHRSKDISHARESFPCQSAAISPQPQQPSLPVPPRDPVSRRREGTQARRTKKSPYVSSRKLLNDRRNYFLTRSLSRFFSSLMNSCTSLKSMYTEANRT